METFSAAVRAWGSAVLVTWEENTPDEVMYYGAFIPGEAECGYGQFGELPVTTDGETWHYWPAVLVHRCPKTTNDGSGEILGNPPEWLGWR